jgi:hypothetical protein
MFKPGQAEEARLAFGIEQWLSKQKVYYRKELAKEE